MLRYCIYSLTQLAPSWFICLINITTIFTMPSLDPSQQLSFCGPTGTFKFHCKIFSDADGRTVSQHELRHCPRRVNLSPTGGDFEDGLQYFNLRKHGRQEPLTVLLATVVGGVNCRNANSERVLVRVTLGAKSLTPVSSSDY